MRLDWLKRSMPRSLYGRAALILLLPVVVLQIVVSIVFIQRHFEGVTRQMTQNVIAEMRYIVDRIDAAPDPASAQLLAAQLGTALELEVYLPAVLNETDRRNFFDLSGRVVIETLRRRLPEVAGVDLASETREVRVSLRTDHGGMILRLPREHVSASNPHQLLVLMILAGVLLSLISYIFLRNQLRPITRLADAAEAFGKGRHVSYRPAGAREVRSAGLAFLDMRARIERQIEQRTLMLSGVSHDLRTPLTRMTLSLSLLDQTEEVAEIQRDVREMNRLVDEFLAFARGDALDAVQPVDAHALVLQVIDDARRGGKHVEQGVVEETGAVEMRPLAVTRALENLIGNAVRYGSRARISLARQNGFLRFTVEDNGPGIPEDRREDALKPFMRLEPARNQNRSAGVGLGLSIAADIARRHGGSLRLGRSEDLGGLSANLLIAL